MFQILQTEVHVTACIDNQTIWKTVVKLIYTRMPEVMNRCREKISKEFVKSICVIERNYNGADLMTKNYPNPALVHIIRTNSQEVPVNRVFML